MVAGGWLRRAGRGRLRDGPLVLWSVAEGARGRRWRASARDATGALLDDLLLEIEPSGRLARLEVTTLAGQLTFHAEADEQRAHGNIVTRDGMRHLALPWAPGRQVEIPWSPVADAVLVGTVGRTGIAEVATLDPELVPVVRTVALERAGEGSWQLDGRPVGVTADGLPDLPDGEIWALEAPDCPHVDERGGEGVGKSAKSGHDLSNSLKSP